MSDETIAFIVALGAIYVVLISATARTTRRNGRLLLYGFGFLIPVLWLAGALMGQKGG